MSRRTRKREAWVEWSSSGAIQRGYKICWSRGMVACEVRGRPSYALYIPLASLSQITSSCSYAPCLHACTARPFSTYYWNNKVEGT